MIGENRVALTVQPWPVILPIVAISFITIGINLVLDGYRRRTTPGRPLQRQRTHVSSEMAGLTVEDLRVDASEADVDIVSDISFTVEPGSALGLVGESGCGKTTVAMALLGFARPGTKIVERACPRRRRRHPNAGRGRATRHPWSVHLLRPAEPRAGPLSRDESGRTGRRNGHCSPRLSRSQNTAGGCLGCGTATDHR